jgi:predicted ATPase
MNKRTSKFWPFDPQKPSLPEFFVGRKPERDTIENLADEVIVGQTKIGFIIGEKGYGKTSLSQKCKDVIEKNIKR